MLDQIEDSADGHVQDQVSIKNMIAKLPVGLEDMYNRILFDHARLSGVDQKIQLLILSLVTHSTRPLRLIEIAHALGPENCGDRNPKEIVRGACGPLLEIMEDEVVQILHHSFTEFLLDTSRSQDTTKGIARFPVLDPTVCHVDIALTCLRYLRFRSLTTNEAEAELVEDSESDCDDFLYSSRKSLTELRDIDPLHFPFLDYSVNQ